MYLVANSPSEYLRANRTAFGVTVRLNFKCLVTLRIHNALVQYLSKIAKSLHVTECVL